MKIHKQNESFKMISQFRKLAIKCCKRKWKRCVAIALIKFIILLLLMLFLLRCTTAQCSAVQWSSVCVLHNVFNFNLIIWLYNKLNIETVDDGFGDFIWLCPNHLIELIMGMCYMCTFTFCLPIYPVNGMRWTCVKSEKKKRLLSGDSLVHTEFYYAKSKWSEIT